MDTNARAIILIQESIASRGKVNESIMINKSLSKAARKNIFSDYPAESVR